MSARDAGPFLELAGADRAAVARGLLSCMLRHVMIDGTFHAGPHPGNVLVRPDGKLALTDFGLVGWPGPLQQAWPAPASAGGRQAGPGVVARSGDRRAGRTAAGAAPAGAAARPDHRLSGAPHLSANVRLFADERKIRLAAAMVSRAVMAFIGASVGLLSVGLLAIHVGPVLLAGPGHGGGTSVFRLFGYLGLFFAVVLILRVLIAIAREGIGLPRGIGAVGRSGRPEY